MLTIKIQTGNAAFSAGDIKASHPSLQKDLERDPRNFECARILREMAKNLERCSPDNSSLYSYCDSNGNKVGTLTINNR